MLRKLEMKRRMDAWEILFTWILMLQLMLLVRGNHDAKRLYDDLLRKSKYNKLIRPVGNSSDQLVVKLGMKVGQLIDVVGCFFPNIFTLIYTVPLL